MTKKRKKPVKRKKRNSPATYRKYSDEEIAEILAVLDANEGNRKKTAEVCGVPMSTIESWEKGRAKLHPVVAKLKETKRTEIADELEILVRKLIFGARKKIALAPLNHTMVGVGIGIEKMQLLRGLATSRPGEKDLTDEQLIERLKSISSRLAAIKQPEPNIAGPQNGHISSLGTNQPTPAGTPIMDPVSRETPGTSL